MKKTSSSSENDGAEYSTLGNVGGGNGGGEKKGEAVYQVLEGPGVGSYEVPVKTKTLIQQPPPTEAANHIAENKSAIKPKEEYSKLQH